jgi:hypothetical protein
MGDSRSFDLFAKVIFSNFPPKKYPKIADVAGGKGGLQTALREKGYNVTTFDKRKGRRNRPGRFQYQYRWFNENIKDKFNLLVGMHPDEATDVIILEAAKRKIPFVVCPCCVKPYAVPFCGAHNYWTWVKHLKRLAHKNGFTVIETLLRMNGKNLVLIGKTK